MNYLITSIILLTLQGCSTVSRTSFKNLKIGMTKDQVSDVLGPMSSPTEIKESASGNGKVNYVYGESGYIWYDQKNKLEGFAVYEDLTKEDAPYQSVLISRASGYLLNQVDNKKAFLTFQNYNQRQSNEANLVFLQNKKNIESFFEGKGYSFVNNLKKASVIIIIKLGISEPKSITEVSSTPFYNLNYTPPQTSTTSTYSNTGMYLGTEQTTTNPYGSYNTYYGGQNVQTYTRKEYLRSLELICLKNTGNSSKKEILWSAIANSSGSSEDLREIFPFLFYAASNVVERSVSFKNFNLAWFHTGVRELVGIPAPKQK